MRYLYILLFVQIPLILWGQPRSLEQAINLASDYFEVQSSRMAPKMLKNGTYIEGDSVSKTYLPFYCLADSIDGRAILISGDLRMETILGVTDMLPQADSNLPSPMLDLIELYTKEYIFLQENNPQIEKDALTAVAAPDVSPLLATQWGQGSPFNDLCPNNYPSGCVATAMAQIMNYHQFPESGYGSFSYTSRSKRLRLSCDFASITFDWQNMVDKYDSKSNSRQRQAVASLLYACGVSVSMDYDKGGSGAYDLDVPYALINYFGYNANVVCLQRDYYSREEWLDRLYTELEANRPILYCGSDSREGGHAFIVDGCRSSDNKVHVNWGWNGEFDGYYVLSSLNPNHYRFSTNQSMINNFAPSIIGTHEDIFYASKFEIKGTIKDNSKLTGNISELWCSANRTSYTDKSGVFNCTIGIGIFDSEMNFVKSLAEQQFQNIRTQDINQVSKFSFSLSVSNLSDGVYYIAPFAQAEGSVHKTRIRTLGAKYDTVGFTVVNGSVNGENPNDDEPVSPEDKDIAWVEDFEEIGFPNDLSQKNIQGSGKWESIVVLFSSSDGIPSPAHGKGFAFLKAQANSLSNKRDVCQFITDDILLSKDCKYQLSYKMCKSSKKKDSNDALNILISINDSDWQLLHESSVVTVSSWETTCIALPDNITRLSVAFEGCVGQSSILYIDHIIISKMEDANSISITGTENTNDCGYYTINGLKSTKKQKGINIIREEDGKVYKVIVKQ